MVNLKIGGESFSLISFEISALTSFDLSDDFTVDAETLQENNKRNKNNDVGIFMNKILS